MLQLEEQVRRQADAYDRPHKGMSMIAIRVLISTGISNKVTRMSMRVIPAVGPCGMQRPITGVLMSGILDTFQQAFFSGMLVFSPLPQKCQLRFFHIDIFPFILPSHYCSHYHYFSFISINHLIAVNSYVEE